MHERNKDQIKFAAYNLIEIIEENVPDCHERDAAISHIGIARTYATDAIDRVGTKKPPKRRVMNMVPMLIALAASAWAVIIMLLNWPGA